METQSAPVPNRAAANPWPGPARAGSSAAELHSARVLRQVQLVVHRPHGQASLGPVLNAAIARGLNVLAHAALPDAGGTTWLLVVEQDWLAREAFAAAGLGYLAESVVLVEAAPRASAVMRLGQSLAEAPFAIQYSYAMPVHEDRLVAVFKTADDERALRLLQASLRLGTGAAAPAVA